jgi:hypothetical protein
LVTLKLEKKNLERNFEIIQKTMSKRIITSLPMLLILSISLILNSCSNNAKEPDKKEAQKTLYPSDIIKFFNNWNLILGDALNAGIKLR